MPDDPQRRDEEDLNRELIELLNELRVVLPGVQVLFAFLLAVPFANGWTRITALQKDAYFVAFVAAAASSILLIAPSVHHRVLWREGRKERILRTSNALAIAGTGFLAIGIAAAVFLITDILYGAWWASVIAGIVTVAIVWFWYGLPLLRRD